MLSTTSAPKNKKNNRSLFYRISAWLHLWLGLLSGIVVFIVCVTACIWVFQDEITTMLHPQTKVAREPRPVMHPSALMNIAQKEYPGKRMAYASYQQGKAIYMALGEGRHGNTVLHIHPYTGAIISNVEHKKGETDFFRWILNGHRFLWMPPAIGRPIVNYSILIFVIILITGIVLWWPKKWTKAAKNQSFKIKWKASFKRVNYDLHNVLGFYSLLFLLAMALTGMVYGIKWYSKGLYWVTSAGKTLPDFERPLSDSLQAGKHYTPQAAMDIAWNETVKANPDAQGFYYSFADTARPASAITITIYPTAGKYYNNRSFSFDQHTGKKLADNNPVYGKSFEESTGAAKLRKMNYDIHVGSILGLPGKILAFFASLTGASLPVTGFLVWLGKKRKTKKKKTISPLMVAKSKTVINTELAEA